MITRRKRGVALLWTMILTFITLVICSIMVSAVIKESQIVYNVVDSTQAYANAKTGVDWGKQYLADGGTLPRTECFNFDPGYGVTCANSKNKVTISLQSGGLLGVIDSVGTTNNTTRKIEISVGSSGLAKKTTTSIGSVSKSFAMQFDFWKDSGAANGMIAGVTDGSNNKILLVEDSAGNLNLQYLNPNIASTSVSVKKTDGSVFSLNTPASSNPYAYRAYLKYYKNIGIRLVISDPTTGNCVGFANSSAVGNNLTFGAFTQLALSAGASYVPAGSAGDGEYWLDGAGHYLDNIYADF